MDAQFYSLQKLPRDFKMLGDPYFSKEARLHLFENGVVFYRDSEHATGILKTGTQNNQVMFFSAGVFTDDTFEIDEWADEESDLEDYEDYDSSTQQELFTEGMKGSLDTIKTDPPPDRKAWVVHNERCFILSIDKRAVRRA